MRKIFYLLLLIGASAVLLLSCGQKNEAAKKLYLAISDGNYQGVYEVLRDNPDIDLEDLGVSQITNFSMNDRRALGNAVQEGGNGNGDRIAALLIAHGADVNSVCEDGTTYLMEAVLYPVTFDALLEAGADVNAVNKAGETAIQGLVMGASFDNKSFVMKRMEKLISMGAVVDAGAIQTCLDNPEGYAFTPFLLDEAEIQGKEPGISKGLEYAIRGDDEKLQSELEKQSIPDSEKKYVVLNAAANCSAATLEKIYKKGYSLKVKDAYSNTALELAAQYNDVEAVDFLAKQGLSSENRKFKDDSDEDFMAMSPIIHALIGGKSENIKYFLDRGISFPENDMESPWSTAAADGNINSFRFLFENGYIPDDEDLAACYGELAIRHNANDMLDFLIENFPINFITEEGETPLSSLCTGNEMYAELLLERGGEVTYEAVVNAVEAGFSELVEKMLSKVENINALAEEDNSALAEAVYYGEKDIVEILIEYGEDPNQMYYDEDGYGESAVHVASYCPSADILEYLLHHGGDISLKNSEGKTPYDLAKELGLKENMELLK